MMVGPPEAPTLPRTRSSRPGRPSKTIVGVILEQGRVAEFGPRAALAADPDSHFYRLLQTGLEEVLV